jgi:hypothetical protein
MANYKIAGQPLDCDNDSMSDDVTSVRWLVRRSDQAQRQLIVVITSGLTLVAQIPES